MESTKTPPTPIDNMSQYTSHVLSFIATTQPGSAAYSRKAVTSVLTSVPYPETSYGAVAMHDGPLEGDLIFQLPTYNVVNVHSGVIWPIGFSSRRCILHVTHLLDDFIFLMSQSLCISFFISSRYQLGWIKSYQIKFIFTPHISKRFKGVYSVKNGIE